jgi:hypothetical protein
MKPSWKNTPAFTTASFIARVVERERERLLAEDGLLGARGAALGTHGLRGVEPHIGDGVERRAGDAVRKVAGVGQAHAAGADKGEIEFGFHGKKLARLGVEFL